MTFSKFSLCSLWVCPLHPSNRALKTWKTGENFQTPFGISLVGKGRTSKGRSEPLLRILPTTPFTVKPIGRPLLGTLPQNPSPEPSTRTLQALLRRIWCRTLWHEIITKTTPWELFLVISEGFCALEMSGETLKGLYLKGLLSKHRSIACPLPLALASDLSCGVCTCKWDLQLPSPVRLWSDFPRPRGWRVTTALGNPFPCRTALGNPFPCREVCFAQEAPSDKPPLRLPECPGKKDIFMPTCQRTTVNTTCRIL